VAVARLRPATYVYRLSAGVWKPVETLTSAGASEGDGFGSALAAEGNTLLVGQVRLRRPRRTSGTGGRGGNAEPPAPPPADTAIGTVQVFGAAPTRNGRQSVHSLQHRMPAHSSARR
jgi:hypothetical protein